MTWLLAAGLLQAGEAGLLPVTGLLCREVLAGG